METEDQQFNETLAVGIKEENMMNIHRRNKTFSPPDVAFLTYMNEWMKSRGWEDNRRALLQYIFNMWTVSLEVSIQSRHWQPLSVHLWAYCTHPAHDVNDVICEGWPQHHGSASPTLFEQWCGFFYVPHEPEV